MGGGASSDFARILGEAALFVGVAAADGGDAESEIGGGGGGSVAGGFGTAKTIDGGVWSVNDGGSARLLVTRRFVWCTDVDSVSAAEVGFVSTVGISSVSDTCDR